MKRLLLVIGVVGLVALVIKKRSADHTEWQGLTETQAREKLNDRLPDKVPEDKREIITDKIVTKMRDKGVIIDVTDDAEAPEAAAEAEAAPA